jgi:hypothetical protein
MAEGNAVRAAVEKAREEMLFIGPDHPYYPLLRRDGDRRGGSLAARV